jgi:DNA helicase-2/ATP-dependent DNA helicase PcrA
MVHKRGISRIENIEELLNGMRDFVEKDKEVADARGSLSEFSALLLILM